MPVMKMLPLLASWGCMVVLLTYGLKPFRRAVAVGSATGFVAGLAGAAMLLSSLRGDLPFAIVRSVVAGWFILFWLGAVAAHYVSGERTAGSRRLRGLMDSAAFAAVCSLSVGITVGAVSVCRFAPQGKEWSLATVLVLCGSGVLLTLIAGPLEIFLPESLDARSTAAVAIASLLLLAASFVPRIDLFSPLVMKVMKFIHDFVHQFFESMLIPDHMFFRQEVWDYIGILFGNRVGFWGGAAIWFAPVVFVAVAIRRERLPSVAHIRQGAARRKLLARYIRERRGRLLVPALSAVILAGAVYQSRFPSVQYWDPQPVKVTAASSGAISIGSSAEIDLKDGRIHKFLYRQGGREARFMVLMTPGGAFTVTLDACAICKPDGYGQTQGAVLCYYCNTLIPLETVGKPGGCNPVPVPFTLEKDEIRIDGMVLLNRWGETVQATTRIREDRK